MITRLLLIAVLCVSTTPLAADDSTQANRLLVEAMKLIQAAGTKQTATEGLPLMERALAKLNEIVENHPSSDLAVKLITGQQIGDVSLAGVAHAVEILSQLQKQEAAKSIQDAARTTCIESLDVANPQCHRWLYDIGRAQLQAGDLQSARETAMLIWDSSIRRDLLSDIAKWLYDISTAQLQAGDLQGARETAKSIRDFRIREDLLGDIDRYARLTNYDQRQVQLVDDQLGVGNLENALETAKSIYDDGVRAQKLHVIALAQAERVGNQLRAGNLEGALATARSIEYISIRDQAFRDVAEGQAEAGNLSDALATAESIEADHLRTRILDVIKRRTQ